MVTSAAFATPETAMVAANNKRVEDLIIVNSS
jgi:Mg2+/Co2+ transporter CorB